MRSSEETIDRSTTPRVPLETVAYRIYVARLNQESLLSEKEITVAQLCRLMPCISRSLEPTTLEESRQCDRYLPKLWAKKETSPDQPEIYT